ncbi:metallopeptidase family protein [candidate division WOR-3 bacterium]|uniref:Metallopeptidase family protein n=1 Tax=candidate division WOR-3 bacterium TaxID=2052148 RepID=A0A938BRV1_UNCW3|nr:metallopeptidase family protein [candidate division WOR-3 bacterium]
MELERFSELVDEAIASIPEDFRSKLDNITVIIEPLAQPGLAREMGLNPWGLLGVYQGVPYAGRGPWYGNVLPDRILIFQKPIEQQARTAARVRKLVRQVVIHEVGHYFGLSDDELRRLEAEADRKEAAGSGDTPNPQ